MSRQKQVAFKRTKVYRLETPWTGFSQVMLESQAFRKMSGACIKVLLFLELQNLKLGGHTNGSLIMRARDLAEFGVRPSSQKKAIEEAIERGWVRCQGIGQYARYRLTARQTKNKDEWSAPTDNWRSYKSAAPVVLDIVKSRITSE